MEPLLLLRVESCAQFISLGVSILSDDAMVASRTRLITRNVLSQLSRRIYRELMEDLSLS